MRTHFTFTFKLPDFTRLHTYVVVCVLLRYTFLLFVGSLPVLLDSVPRCACGTHVFFCITVAVYGCGPFWFHAVVVYTLLFRLVGCTFCLRYIWLCRLHMPLFVKFPTPHTRLVGFGSLRCHCRYVRTPLGSPHYNVVPVTHVLRRSPLFVLF